MNKAGLVAAAVVAATAVVGTMFVVVTSENEEKGVEAGPSQVESWCSYAGRSGMTELLRKASADKYGIGGGWKIIVDGYAKSAPPSVSQADLQVVVEAVSAMKQDSRTVSDQASAAAARVDAQIVVVCRNGGQ